MPVAAMMTVIEGTMDGSLIDRHRKKCWRRRIVDSIIASLCDDFFASPVQKTGHAVTTAFLPLFDCIRAHHGHSTSKGGESDGKFRAKFSLPPSSLLPRNLLPETKGLYQSNEHDERAKYGHHTLAREALS